MPIFEFCEVAAGPFCGLLLADMGVDVIKVERPGSGGSMRQWEPLSEDFSENFAIAPRGCDRRSNGCLKIGSHWRIAVCVQPFWRSGICPS
ncbi:MAG TPA: CoA transferase [Bradyrhizobium sp.]|nr:CoA transferase [Bradyrhizobium sp.]